MSLLEKAAGVMARHSNRRGFLTKTALFGTALAANPVGYVLRPTDAYASICSCRGSQCDCGSLCCDGYTGFCCELNGVNACPAGTALGGWWKVDSSSYCGGSGPRYYLDCNYFCPPGCGCGSSGVCSGSCSGANCGCTKGCGSRKFGCTGFRYGQCNNQIACLGPILCRVVTCEAPWELDPNCGQTVRVDEGTRNHNAPCLQEPTERIGGAFTKVQVTRRGVHVVGYTTNRSVTKVVLTANGGRLITLPLRDKPPSGQAPKKGARWFFDLVTPAVGSVSLCARSANDQGLIDCRSIIVPGNAPIGTLDRAWATPGSINVSGWAFDNDTSEPTTVHVYVNGVAAGAGRADRDRPDVRAVYPGAPIACGYKISVPAVAGPASVRVYAINEGNRTVNPSIGTANVVLPGGAPFGVIDVAEISSRGIDVSGWVIDPDTTKSIEVHAYVNGAPATRALANRDRPDVARVHGGYGKAHGFSFTVPIDTKVKTHELCLYGIDKVGGDANRRFACKTVHTPRGAPFGTLETVAPKEGAVRVAGWAIDPSLGNRPTDVIVTVDGRRVFRGPAKLIRNDVARLHGHGNRHGFAIRVPVSRGRHEVCVFAADDRGLNRELGCNVVRVT